MKIMVLYASAGGGHRKAAEALAQNARKAGDEVLLVDGLKEVGAVEDRLVCDSYRIMARYVPQAFGSLYRQANKERGLSCLVPKINRVFSRRLLPVLEAYQPDVIISTYHFLTEMVSDLKREGLVKAPLVCVITDYGLHRAWLAPEVDLYMIACEEMLQQLITAGVDEQRIRVTGLPVANAFTHYGQQELAKERLGLLPQLPVVLMMAGSFGVDMVIAMYRAAAALADDFQLVVITGRNQLLYQAFRQEIKISGKPTKLVSFTNKVADYMQAADLLVTKPGGLTVSEALASQLPMVVFDAIPGQEEDNARFLVHRGMAMEVRNGKEAASVIGQLMAAPSRLAAMREACSRFDKSDAAGKIVTFCHQLAASAE